MNYVPAVTKGGRLGAMLIDHIAMTFIMAIFFIPVLFKNLSDVMAESSGHPPVGPGPEGIFSGPLVYVGLFGLSLYLCKDSFNGRSFGKLVMGLQVVNNETGEAASPLRCLVRNLFIVLWPLEVLVTLAQPERRIGDLVAGTRVAAYDKNTPSTDVKLVQIAACVLIAFGLTAGLSAVFMNMIPSFPQADFNATSYNVANSTMLTDTLNKTMGDRMTVTVSVYDKTAESDQLKFVSVMCVVEDENIPEETKAELEQRIVALMPDSVQFKGTLQYVYRSTTKFKSEQRFFSRKH